jgi:pyruvate dehydrogenase E1 component alpha subunit
MVTIRDYATSDAGEVSKDLALEMFRRMVTVRRFETRAVELYKAGEMGGTLHTAVGQEATCVGACLALRPDDCITTTHRGHGDVIAKGAPVEKMMAELFGRATGICKGKGGSLHVADFGIGAIGANGIVGAGIPAANGLALAFKLRGLDRVAAAFFGDGATNQGTFFETLNLAALWRAPTLFICHNNQYAMGVQRLRHQPVAQIADFARPFGIPGVTVDGNDVIAVYEAVSAAVQRARSGEGPSLIECLTYRWLGHHATMSDYRPREEVDAWRARDPIKLLYDRLVSLNPTWEAELDQIDREVAARIEAAVEFARQSPFPDTKTADEDVYYDLEIR